MIRIYFEATLPPFKTIDRCLTKRRLKSTTRSFLNDISLWEDVVVLKGPSFVEGQTVAVYLELVYLVTALVPSDTACLANSPGRRRRTAVWISLLVMVERRL